ncbi:MAG: sugar phosphate nucleotidyltransferase [Solirubrobacteraceae bacterium]
MQALILVGGEGTRLRPLTSTVPKPVVTLVDRPFMAYMLEWLKGHGIDEVVFSLGFLPDGVRDVLGDGSHYGLKLHYVEEPEPLGTGGALKYAEDLLHDRFAMLNGDVLTDIHLSAQIARHERTGARGTLALVPVEDPTAYGLVRLHSDDSVKGFLEKPSLEEIDTDLISAGAYVLERDVLDLLVKGENASIERDVFPKLVGEGLYGYRGSGYWMDIGTPQCYLQGTWDILERNVATAAGASLDDSFLRVDDGVVAAGRIVPPALVAEGCEIADGARVGALAVLGRDVKVSAGATVEQAVVLDGARIGEGAFVHDAIIGPGAVIGAHTRVERGAVIGDGVTLGESNVLSNGARVFPGVSIPDHGILF